MGLVGYSVLRIDDGMRLSLIFVTRSDGLGNLRTSLGHLFNGWVSNCAHCGKIVGITREWSGNIDVPSRTRSASRVYTYIANVPHKQWKVMPHCRGQKFCRWL